MPDINITIGISTRQVNQGLDSVGKRVKSLSASVHKLATNMRRFGTDLLVVGSALVGAFGIPLKRAADNLLDVNDALQTVQAVTGFTDEKIKRLGHNIEQVGLSTKFFQKDIAAATVTMARAGLSFERINALIPKSATLAMALGTDIQTATNLMISGMEAFRDSVAKAPSDIEAATNVSDLFARASAASRIDAEVLVSFMTTASSAIASMGVDAKETVAVLGTMQQVMNNGARAAYALNQSMQYLRALPGKKVAEPIAQRLKAMGMTLDDVNPRVVGLVKALKNLVAAIGTNDVLIGKVFGVRARNAFDFVKALSSKLDEISGKIGAAAGDLLPSAEEMAETMMKSLRNQLLLVASAVEALGLAIARTFLPDVVELGLVIRDKVLVPLTEWVNQHKELVKWTVKAIAVTVSAVFALAALSFTLSVLVRTGLYAVRLGHAVRAFFMSSLSPVIALANALRMLGADFVSLLRLAPRRAGGKAGLFDFMIPQTKKIVGAWKAAFRTIFVEVGKGLKFLGSAMKGGALLGGAGLRQAGAGVFGALSQGIGMAVKQLARMRGPLQSVVKLWQGWLSALKAWSQSATTFWTGMERVQRLMAVRGRALYWLSDLADVLELLTTVPTRAATAVGEFFQILRNNLVRLGGLFRNAGAQLSTFRSSLSLLLFQIKQIAKLGFRGALLRQFPQWVSLLRETAAGLSLLVFKLKEAAKIRAAQVIANVVKQLKMLKLIVISEAKLKWEALLRLPAVLNQLQAKLRISKLIEFLRAFQGAKVAAAAARVTDIVGKTIRGVITGAKAVVRAMFSVGAVLKGAGAGVGGLVGGLMGAFKSGGFAARIGATFLAIAKSVLGTLVVLVKNVVLGLVKVVFGVIKAAWTTVVGVVKAGIFVVKNVVVGVVKAVSGMVLGIFKMFFGFVKIGVIFGAIMAAIDIISLKTEKSAGFLDRIKKAWEVIMKMLHPLMVVMDIFTDFFRILFVVLYGVARELPAQIKPFLNDVVNASDGLLKTVVQVWLKVESFGGLLKAIAAQTAHLIALGAAFTKDIFDSTQEVRLWVFDIFKAIGQMARDTLSYIAGLVKEILGYTWEMLKLTFAELASFLLFESKKWLREFVKFLLTTVPKAFVAVMDALKKSGIFDALRDLIIGVLIGSPAHFKKALQKLDGIVEGLVTDEVLAGIFGEKKYEWSAYLKDIQGQTEQFVNAVGGITDVFTDKISGQAARIKRDINLVFTAGKNTAEAYAALVKAMAGFGKKVERFVVKMPETQEEKAAQLKRYAKMLDHHHKARMQQLDEEKKKLREVYLERLRALGQAGGFEGADPATVKAFQEAKANLEGAARRQQGEKQAHKGAMEILRGAGGASPDAALEALDARLKQLRAAHAANQAKGVPTPTLEGQIAVVERQIAVLKEALSKRGVEQAVVFENEKAMKQVVAGYADTFERIKQDAVRYAPIIGDALGGGIKRAAMSHLGGIMQEVARVSDAVRNTGLGISADKVAAGLSGMFGGKGGAGMNLNPAAWAAGLLGMGKGNGKSGKFNALPAPLVGNTFREWGPDVVVFKIDGPDKKEMGEFVDRWMKRKGAAGFGGAL